MRSAALDTRAIEVELTLGGGPVRGQLGARVAPQNLVEQVARLGRVEEVGGDRGVERQAAHVDARVEQRAHDRLGLVGGDRAAAVGRQGDQCGEGRPHPLVGQQRPGQPCDPGRGRVGHERQPVERRAALAAVPGGGDRQGCVVPGGPGRIQRRHGLLGGRKLGDNGLQHLGRRAADAEVLAQRLGQPLPEAVELEEVEQPPDLVHVGVPAVELVDGHAHRGVEHELHDLGVLADVGLVLGQAAPQLGRLLVQVLEDAVEPAVGVDQLGGGLLPHPGHAGQVVGRVAAQRGVLPVEPGRDAGALLDPGLVVHHVVGHAPAVVEHLDVGVLDELVDVPVAGDDDHVEPRVPALGGEGGDDVVGLVAGQLEDADAQRLDHLAHQADLLAQDVGRLGPAGLVGGDPLVAERRLGPVERDRHAPVAVVAHEVDEHRGEPEHRVGDLARCGGQVGRQGEERAVGERVAVDEEERVAGHGSAVRRRA